MDEGPAHAGALPQGDRPGAEGWRHGVPADRIILIFGVFTFAAMARTLGIPSRVAVGFTPGVINDEGWYSVLGKNAHAWPELWFDGIGWVLFEPTPAGITDPDPLASASAMNLGIEQLVRRCPEQYQWSYRRFPRALY